MASFTKETRKNVEFAKGGTTPMFGSGDNTGTASNVAAGEQEPGGTAHDTSGKTAGPGADGGKTKMFSYSPSVPATGGITSAR